MRAEDARKLFDYDPSSGVLRWKTPPRRGVAGGTVAGSISNFGYRVIRFKRKTYLASHIIWLIIHGKPPKEQIDHKDRNRSNDQLLNLREANVRQQLANRQCRRQSKTKLKGVSIKKLSDGTVKYRAGIMIRGIFQYLGYFESKEEAHSAYMIEAKKEYGPFALNCTCKTCKED